MSLPLRYSHYRFTLRTETAVCLTDFPTAVLRSALGVTLRRAACTTKAPVCDDCPVHASCAYGNLFDPQASATALHSGFQDVPRPYVLHLPAPLPVRLPGGAFFRFDLVLVESALLALPALVNSLYPARNAEGGMTLGKGTAQGRVALHRVEAIHPPSGPEVLWTHTAPRLRALPAPVPLGCAPAPSCQVLRLRMVTPLRLREEGALCSAPGVPALVKALARRVRALAATHGRLTEALDQELLVATEYAGTLAARATHFRPVKRGRYSSRQHQRFELDALLGTLTLGPGWQPLWPLLDAGRLLHVGKNTTHGLGQYVLDEVPHPAAKRSTAPLA